MSWVESLPSGRYRAVYRDDDDRRHSKSFDRNPDTKAWLAAAKADQVRGQWVHPRGGAILFGEWAELGVGALAGWR